MPLGQIRQHHRLIWGHSLSMLREGWEGASFTKLLLPECLFFCLEIPNILNNYVLRFFLSILATLREM